MHVREGSCCCHFRPQEENRSNYSSLLSVENGLSFEYRVSDIKAYTTHRQTQLNIKVFPCKTSGFTQRIFPFFSASLFFSQGKNLPRLKAIRLQKKNTVVKIVPFLIFSRETPGSKLNLPAIFNENIRPSFSVPPKILWTVSSSVKIILSTLSFTDYYYYGGNLSSVSVFKIA